MIAIKNNTRTTTLRNSNECRNTRREFHVFSAALTKAGQMKNLPITTDIIKKIMRAKSQEYESPELCLLIEVYQYNHDFSINKVSSVKAPLRFTVLWAAVKEIIKRIFKREVL